MHAGLEQRSSERADIQMEHKRMVWRPMLSARTCWLQLLQKELGAELLVKLKITISFRRAIASKCRERAQLGSSALALRDHPAGASHCAQARTALRRPDIRLPHATPQ